MGIVFNQALSKSDNVQFNSVAVGDKYGFDGDTNTHIQNIGADWLGFTAGGLSMAA